MKHGIFLDLDFDTKKLASTSFIDIKYESSMHLLKIVEIQMNSITLNLYTYPRTKSGNRTNILLRNFEFKP